MCEAVISVLLNSEVSPGQADATGSVRQADAAPLPDSGGSSETRSRDRTPSLSSFTGFVHSEMRWCEQKLQHTRNFAGYENTEAPRFTGTNRSKIRQIVVFTVP